MCCMSFKSALKKLGQIFSKMAFTNEFSRYEVLQATSTMKNVDSVNGNIYGSSYSSGSRRSSEDFSSAYISPDVSDFKPQQKQEKPRSSFDLFDLSQICVNLPPNDPWSFSGNHSPDKSSIWSENSNINEWPNFQQSYDDFSNMGSHTTALTVTSDFTYDLLSSYCTLNEEESLLGNNYSICNYQEYIRLEFEMNGKTVDMPASSDFEPCAMSTPLVDRKLQHQPLPAAPLQSEPYELQDHFNAGYQENHYVNVAVPQNNYKPKRKSLVKPHKKSLLDHCPFCKNNGLAPNIYHSHTVVDKKGRCSCPSLRQYICPICKCSGDDAHTIKYCPKRKIVTEEDMAKIIQICHYNGEHALKRERNCSLCAEEENKQRRAEIYRKVEMAKRGNNKQKYRGNRRY